MYNRMLICLLYLLIISLHKAQLVSRRSQSQQDTYVYTIG